jgi:hypothetical protein
MTKTAAARTAQVWETKWAFVPTMNHNQDARLHLCVVVRIEDGIATILPTSTKRVEDRPSQRPILWGGAEVYPATNRVFTMPVGEWVGLAKAEARHQPDREVRGFLKQELSRA